MYTLFISTFDKLITIGLLKNGEVLDKKIKESDRNHSIYVMPMIEEILSVNEITTSYLNEIIVDELFMIYVEGESLTDKINMADVLILRMYLAKWNVVLGPAK